VLRQEAPGSGTRASGERLIARTARGIMGSNLWYLKQCKLFEDLTPRQAERLEGRALVRTFPRHALIYAPAEPGESVLVLASGRVKIKHLTPDGKETILAFIEEGELFGELALLDGAPRSEFAEAVVDARVLALPCEDLLWLMEQRPEVALAVTRVVGQRRRQMENRLRSVLFMSSRERLVHLLRELAETRGEPFGQRGAIRLPLAPHEPARLSA